MGFIELTARRAYTGGRTGAKCDWTDECVRWNRSAGVRASETGEYVE